MKRKMFFRLTVVLVAAVSVLIACTQDYSTDIKSLQDKYDALEQQFNDLQGAIDNGSVISKVEQTANGIKVTAKDGKTYEVTNGEKGEPGDSWEIGANGNWFKNGVDSGKPARGEQGLQGPQGEQGEQGEQGIQGIQGLEGQPGKDGDFYKPCTDKESEGYGHWILVNGETAAEQVLDEMWLPVGTITAVWDEDAQTISFHNVAGVDGGVITIINPKVDLKGLAVIPEIWDATMGLPMAKVYAIYPSNLEFTRVVLGDGWNKLWMFNGANEAVGFGNSDKFYDRNIWSFGGLMGFATMLWSSYIGATNKTQSNPANLNYPGYSSSWDVTSNDFMRSIEWYEEWLGADPENYTSGGGGGSGTHWEQSYQALKETFENELLPILHERLNMVATSGQETWSRQIPVSAINFKYRLTPAGANINDYQFYMLDRTVEAYTKAEGDNRADAVVLDAQPTVNAIYDDQLDVTAYVNYYKLWANMPVEWFFKLWGAKVVHSYNLYNWKNGDGVQQSNGMRDWLPETIGSDIANSGVGYGAELNNLKRWMDAQGLSYQTIIALEAAKDNDGAEAVVSDWASVKMEYVQPYWTAYDHHNPTLPVAKWGVPRTLYNWWLGGINYKGTGEAYENDVMKVTDTYDVAAHMRFADPYYGRLENLGFDVRYDFYALCPETNAVPQAAKDNTTGAVNLGTGEQVYDEDGNIVSGVYGAQLGASVGTAYQHVIIERETGKVSVKADYQKGLKAEQVINKYVFVVADASIYNHATKTWYNSGNIGQATGNPANWSTAAGTELPGFAQLLGFDEYAGAYCLRIDPADETTIEYDLGEFDYFALPEAGTIKAPKNILLEAAGVSKKADFNTLFNNPTAQNPAGFSAEFSLADDKDDCFAITINEATALGVNTATYTFTNKVYYASTINYKIKYKIVANVPAELIPTLNPDYLLPETEDVVVVKGKAVENTWRPQSSIREHFKNYEAYAEALEENDATSHMFVKLKQGEEGAKVFTWPGDTQIPEVSYTEQEIKLDGYYEFGEAKREVVVEAYLVLANGAVVTDPIKSYTVRFVNPFEISAVEGITLETHTIDWCRALAAYTIKEVGTGKTLVEWDGTSMASSLTEYAQNIYVGVFNETTSTWKSGATTDESFGNRLFYVPNTGWYYWNNLGTLLQQDKATTFSVEVVNTVAKLKAAGTITIKKSADSAAEHPGDAVELPQGAVNVSEQ